MAGMVKGPAIFLAQFAGDAPPFNSFGAICQWAGSPGYRGVQIPSWDIRLFDLAKAAASKTYCEEVSGIAASHGLAITELSTHLQGQLVAVNPAYDEAFDAFAPVETHGRPRERQRWAVEQMLMAAKASRHLGLGAHATFSGALAWPFVYPWPQRAPGLIEAAFAELARRWKPILDAFDEEGVDVAFEIHPGEDIFDGATFERFLERLKGHKRCNILYDPSHLLLQQLDYLAFLDIYHERVKAFHAKDAEFNPTGARASIRATPPGSIGPAGSVRWATGASISAESSPSSRNTAIPPGRCSNGNAASNIPRTERARARSSSSVTSSASPKRRSTTSPAARSTRSRSNGRWDCAEGRKRNGDRRTQRRGAGPQDQARHGRRRRRRLHRRGASARRAHGRPL